MIKKLLALAACALTFFTVCNAAVTADAADDLSRMGATISVSADKTSAYPGDEITFTVSIKENELTLGSQFDILIPDGLKYNGATINESAKSTLALDEHSVTPKDGRLEYLGYSANNARTVASGGVVLFTFKCKAEKLGSYDLTASSILLSDKDINHIGCAASGVTVNVVERPVAVTGVTVSPTAKTLKTKGEAFELKATVSPANAANKAVTYASSNNNVATVSAEGTVVAVGNGKATITVTTKDGGKTAKCEVTVNIPHVHSLKEVKAKAPTCAEKGNNTYYKCDGCGKVFKDSAGKTETTVEKETLQRTAHKFTKKDTAEIYLKSKADCQNPAIYYYCCEVCGAADEKTFENGEKDPNNHKETTLEKEKKATEEEDGYSGDKVCKACKKVVEQGKVIEKLVHMKDVKKVEAKAATDKEDGNIEYYICNGCGKLYKDADGKVEIKQADTVVKAENSTSSEADSSETEISKPDESSSSKESSSSVGSESNVSASSLTSSSEADGSGTGLLWGIIIGAIVLAAAILALIIILIVKNR